MLQSTVPGNYKCRNARSFPVAMLEVTKVTDSGFCPTGEVRTLSGHACTVCLGCGVSFRARLKTRGQNHEAQRVQQD